MVLACLASASLGAAQTCDCEVSESRVKEYDALLELSADEVTEVDATHLPYGQPTKPAGATNEKALHQAEYVINYDADLRVPTWVAYRLRDVDVNADRERTECFRRDLRLTDDDAAFCEDYEEPIFDRGHMVPNADMTRSESAMINTYMFTNMVPQPEKFNRVIWARLEGYVRDWARLKGTIYVVTGAVFDRDDNDKRDKDSDAHLVDPRKRVAVPSHFYKIILFERPNTFIEALAIMLPNVNESPTGKARSDTYLNQHIVSINEIEKVTGIDFFRGLQDSKEVAVEKAKAERIWPRG